MAFDPKKLCTIGVGGDNSVHMYSTPDADTVVETSDYFLDAHNRLKKGDFIHANLDTDGSQEQKTYTVQTSSSSGVTIGFPTHA